MRSACALVVVVAVVQAGGAAHAQEDLTAAREHYRRGSTLYDLRRYKDAAREYELAYEAKDDPALLFNIGQAYRLANDPSPAIASYRAYLRRVPEAPNRIEVEVFLEELQKELDQQKRAQEAKPVEPQAPQAALSSSGEPRAPVGPSASPSTEPASPGDRGRAKRVAGIALGVSGVALLVGGAVFGGLAQSASNQITHPQNPGKDRFDPSLDARGRAYYDVEIAALVVGGAALVAGVALFAVSRREARRVALVPALGPGRAGLSLDVRF